MKLGINTYTYMWSIGFQFGDKAAWPEHPMTAMALLEKAHELDVHVVQYGPNLPLAKLSVAEIDALARQAQAWDIELELGTRGLEYDHLSAQVELAKRLGATLLRTIPEIGGANPPLADIPGHLRRILPVLEREGIKLAMENGKIPAQDLADVIDTVGSPLIGVVLDMVNSMAVPEGWKEVTRILAPYTMCLHFKDFTVKRVWSMMGFIVEGTPSTKGLVDVPWLFDTLKASKYDFNVIIELWPPEQKTLAETVALEQAWAVESVPLMRAYIKD